MEADLYGQQEFDEDSDDWSDIEEDADEMELMNCGMLNDGTCLNAGSEDCDFDCPLGPIRNPGHWK